VSQRLAAALIAIVAVAAVWYLASGDPAHLLERPAPTSGPVEVGVEYRLSFWCGAAFQLGDYVWLFSESGDWPPARPGDGMTPYEVPGTLTLNSPTRGVFVADVDGSRLDVTRGEPYRDIHQLGPMCF
jgi:hypothetical protein